MKAPIGYRIPPALCESSLYLKGLTTSQAGLYNLYTLLGCSISFHSRLDRQHNTVPVLTNQRSTGLVTTNAWTPQCVVPLNRLIAVHSRHTHCQVVRPVSYQDFSQRWTPNETRILRAGNRLT